MVEFSKEIFNFWGGHSQNSYKNTLFRVEMVEFSEETSDFL